MNKQLYLHQNDEDLTIESIIQILLGFCNGNKPKLIKMLELLDSDESHVDCESVSDTAFFKVLEDFDIIQYGVSFRFCWLGSTGSEILKLLKDE